MVVGVVVRRDGEVDSFRKDDEADAGEENGR